MSTFLFFLLLILFRFKQNTFYFMRLSPISTVSIMYSCMNVTDFISNTLVRVYYDISSKRLQDLLPLNFIITMKKYDTCLIYSTKIQIYNSSAMT